MKTSLFASLILLTQLTAFGQDTPAPPEKVSLWANHAPIGGGEFQEADATITVHRAAKPNGAAFVICPGGGSGALPSFHGTFGSLPGTRFSTTRQVKPGLPDKCGPTRKFSFPRLS